MTAQANRTGVKFGVLLPTREAVMSIEGEKFLAEYYNRTYEAIVKAGLCLAGSWDEVLDRLEAFIDAGARTVVLRFAARDQLEQVEKCAEVLHRRGRLG